MLSFRIWRFVGDSLEGWGLGPPIQNGGATHSVSLRARSARLRLGRDDKVGTLTQTHHNHLSRLCNGGSDIFEIYPSR